MQLVDINAHLPIGAGVTEAWVMPSQTADGDPGTPARSSASAPRIRPYLVAIPGPLDDLERRVAEHKMRGGPAVIRIRPGPRGDGFPLVPWAVSPIPEYCVEAGLALVVDFGTEPSAFPWSEIVQFARVYPGLAIVAIGAPLNGPTAARALDATSNLLFDTSALTAADLPSFGDLARTRGAYRLAYGSGMSPLGSASIASAMTAVDTEAVFAGTAAHLANGTWGTAFL